MTAMKIVAVAWFRREDYARIVELSDDQMSPSFDQWEAKMLKIVDGLAQRGVVGVKTILEPSALIAFARGRPGGKIDSNARAEFAAALLRKERERKH
jgi:hypothetical protein